MTIVYGAAWFRNHIPYFAELAAPMYDLWNNALKDKKCTTTQVAKGVKLKELPEWETSGRKAYNNIKTALAEAMRTWFFDPELRTCFFADANDGFWSILITQCKEGDHLLPWPEQIEKHNPLL